MDEIVIKVRPEFLRACRAYAELQGEALETCIITLLENVLEKSRIDPEDYKDDD